MDTEKINGILSDLEQAGPDYFYLGGGVSRERIKSVEAELGIEFCTDYIQFINKYGFLGLHDEYIAGISNLGFDGGRRELEDVRSTMDGIKEDAEYEPGAGRTILQNFDYEFFYLLDHTDAKVYFADPFSGETGVKYPNLEALLIEFCEDTLVRWQDIPDWYGPK